MKTTLAVVLIIELFASLFITVGCETSDSLRKKGGAPIDPAAYSGDWMYYHTPTTSRPQNDFEFYFKKCSLDHREHPPVGGVWECTTP